MSIPNHVEKTVKMKKVRENDYLLGLDNGYVVDIERPYTRPYTTRITFHTAEGEEAYLEAPDDMPVLVAREGTKPAHEEGTLGAMLHEKQIPGVPCPDHPEKVDLLDDPWGQRELPPYKATHVSVHDGSDAMTLGYDEDDTLLMLVNEAGDRWTDPTTDWKPIEDEPKPITPEGHEARALLAGQLADICIVLSKMLDIWGDHEADLLREDEFPFHRSLEDLHSEVLAAVERIAERNEEALEAATQQPYKPPTLTVGEMIEKLSAFPAETPLLGYTDATDYVNIDGIGNTDFEGGDALVIETRNDYDSRQW